MLRADNVWIQQSKCSQNDAQIEKGGINCAVKSSALAALPSSVILDDEMEWHFRQLRLVTRDFLATR